MPAKSYRLDLAGLMVISTVLSVVLLLGLSAVHQASWIGVAFVAIMLAGMGFSQVTGKIDFAGIRIQKFRIRAWSWPKTLFLLLALATLLGGFLYPPGNYDGLTYRIPRSLRWLAEGGWQWLHSYSARLNTRAIAFEAISTVWISLFRSDRYLFLLNFLAFLSLPSLIFANFRRLGVGGRNSWLWMWILPGGYCFSLQAGSIGNDLIGAFFALAALHFALRCRDTKNFADFALSVLAIALATNSKTSNLPLVLPWLVAIGSSLRIPLKGAGRLAATFLLLAVAALCSFLPCAIMNQVKSGEWSGIQIESPGLRVTSPLVGIATNSACLLLQNAAPPVFPLAGKWNQSLPDLLPSAVYQNFTSDIMRLSELQSEETAGLGFGLTWMLLVWCAFLLCSMLKQKPDLSFFSSLDLCQKGVLLAPYLCLLVYMAKSGVGTAARIVTPYYALLIPLILVFARSSRWSSSRHWRRAGAATIIFSIFVVAVAPARPLWPAVTVLHRLASSLPTRTTALRRAIDVYEVYRNRSDVLRPVRDFLPKDARTVGFISSGDDQETSLWRPFGSRKIVEFLKGDSQNFLKQQGINYVIAGERGLVIQFNSTGAELEKKLGWSIVGKWSLRPKASTPLPESWVVYKIE